MAQPKTYTRKRDGAQVNLVSQIADSGEGTVWETDHAGFVAKLYHKPTPERVEKLKVMVANPPVDPMVSRERLFGLVS